LYAGVLIQATVYLGRINLESEYHKNRKWKQQKFSKDGELSASFPIPIFCSMIPLPNCFALLV
jgi:hypothetical protein